MDKTQEQFRAERNHAFETDDVTYYRREVDPKIMPGLAVWAFHKARYDCTDVSDEKRRESQRYLITNRLNDIHGNPVKIGDPLPK